jgi:hypothetical protein
MAISERRKYPRIRIYSSISCIGMDSDGSCVSQYLGTVQNVSQIGLMIETFEELDADFAQLSIVDLENNLQEINGKVVYCRKVKPGRFYSGISLQGTPAENVDFIKKLVKTYSYNKKFAQKNQS